MPISDFEPEKVEISFKGGSFSVRAISLRDVAFIIQIHKSTVEELYFKLQQRRAAGMDITEDDVAIFIMDVMQETPALAATIICQAADESDQFEVVLKMPAPVQIEALRAIGFLTFTDLAGAKKFGASVIDLVRGLLPRSEGTLAMAAE